MPLLWLRVAVVFYGVGLAYALLALGKRGDSLARFVGPAVFLGFVFHFVSLAEAASAGALSPISIHHSESLLAFMLMAFFAVVYVKYRTLSPGIFVFPLVFVLTFAAAIAQEAPQFASPGLRTGWILLHIALVFAGIAALFFSVAASVLYLVQERALKSKQPGGGLVARLPALEVMDQIGYRSLLFGFPFMTFGLITGSVLAQAEFGFIPLGDAKILLSLVMWGVYMVLIYTRWTAGWRGRRAAVLSTFAFLAAVGAWAANYVTAFPGAAP
jgi:ABC-type uncharacterized transport system permease subunit